MSMKMGDDCKKGRGTEIMKASAFSTRPKSSPDLKKGILTGMCAFSGRFLSGQRMGFG